MKCGDETCLIVPCPSSGSPLQRSASAERISRRGYYITCMT